MAEEQSGQDRTEQPTQKRLDDARRDGQVPRSIDLSTAAVVLVAAGGLRMLGGNMGARLHDLMRTDLALSRTQALDEGFMLPMLAHNLMQGLTIAAPVLGLTLAAALVAPMAIGGWNMSFSALIPNFSRLSPMAGFGRMFSGRGAVELTKAFAKFGVVALLAVIFLKSHASQLLALTNEPIRPALSHAGTITGQALVQIAMSLALIAAIDVPWQLWQYMQKLRMSRHDIRQEHKEREGSPEIKGRVRKVQQEMARRRMMKAVESASVVVVNPTHFSVALKYDENRMRAPIVVAKGVDEVAARIRAVATEHKVPIFEAPPLARALFHTVDLDQEIPSTLYLAVAQVLTYVIQLGDSLRTGALPPLRPHIDVNVEDSRH